MSIKADITGAPRIVRLTLDDDWPGSEEQATWRREMIASGKITAETRALIDARGLTRLPKFEVVQAVLAEIVRDGGWPLRRAFLTATEAQFGVARQMQLMAPPTISFEVFTDPASAEAWLAAPD